jgi:hypothetical protein
MGTCFFIAVPTPISPPARRKPHQARHQDLRNPDACGQRRAQALSGVDGVRGLASREVTRSGLLPG